MKKKKKEKNSVFQDKKRGNFITIKTSLKSILKDHDINFPKINKLVLECNEIVIRTYQFIRLYILYKYYKNEEILELNKDNILYFIRACGERNKQGKKAKNTTLEKELNDFYDKEFKPCINKKKFSLKNKTYVTPYLAQQIQTGFNNNIKEHFITRIRRYMNIFPPSKNIEKKEFNKIKNLILLDKIDEIPKKYQKWANNIKNNFLPNKYEKVYGYDVKIKPEKYLFFMIKMNENIEKYNDKINKNKKLTKEQKRIENKKLFQPIPLRTTIIPNYITIDTNVILSLFKSKGESAMNKKTKLYKSLIWDKIFKTNKRVMKMKDYEYNTIQTDGIGVSICFQKKGKKYRQNKCIEQDDEIYINKLTNEDIQKCKNKKLVSVDPGKHSLVYMLDENKNKLRYTAPQRRIESLRKRNSKIILREKIKNEIIKKETKLSKYNCKTVNYNNFKKYITEKTKLNDDVKLFYEKILFRKLKWRSCIYTRKSEDNFLNNIKKKFGNKNDILICYGNWSNTKQMKYTMPTKGVGLRKIIEKKFNIVLVDEFKTSKLCSKCHNELENYTNNGKKIHRLLVCNNCNKNSGSESKQSIFMNRDINACVNMLNICKTWINKKIRPKMFCRPSNLDLKGKP